MRNSSKKNKNAATFGEWKQCFLDKAVEDGHALIALNQVTRSEVERFVVLELLFNHVKGKYALGANPKDWNAFRSELSRVRRRTLALLSEIKRLRHLKLFSGRTRP